MLLIIKTFCKTHYITPPDNQPFSTRVLQVDLVSHHLKLFLCRQVLGILFHLVPIGFHPCFRVAFQMTKNPIHRVLLKLLPRKAFINISDNRRDLRSNVVRIELVIFIDQHNGKPCIGLKRAGIVGCIERVVARHGQLIKKVEQLRNKIPLWPP